MTMLHRPEKTTKLNPQDDRRGGRWPEGYIGPINCYILSILSTIGVLILIILNDLGWGKYLAYIGSESGGKGE